MNGPDRKVNYRLECVPHTGTISEQFSSHLAMVVAEEERRKATAFDEEDGSLDSKWLDARKEKGRGREIGRVGRGTV